MTRDQHEIMTRDQHEIRRKLRVLEHADKIGDVSKTCRYFGIGRAPQTQTAAAS